jgi:CheY-like chemotaxis protein
MDGEELVRANKSDPALKSIPVILMSALGAPPGPTRADDFIAKPFDLELVRRVIARHLKRDNP